MKSNNKIWRTPLAVRALIGALALGLALTTGFAACDNGGDSDNGGGGGGGGDVTWTVSSDSLGSASSIAYGGGNFVAVGGGSDGHDIYHSSDGATWTKAETTGGLLTGNAVAYADVGGEDYFVAGDRVGNLAYSTDGGANWTKSTQPDGASSYLWSITGIAYGNGKFVAVGQKNTDVKSEYSEDGGITWKAGADLTTDQGYEPKIAYGEVEGTGYFVVYGQSSAAWCTDPASEWTPVTDTNLDGCFIRGIAYGGGKFVAQGRDPNKQFSTVACYFTVPSGEWTPITDTNLLNITKASVAYGGDKFIVVSDSGEMAYSSDGIKWTAVKAVFGDLSNPPAVSAVTYGGDKFVAVVTNITYTTAAYWQP